MAVAFYAVAIVWWGGRSDKKRKDKAKGDGRRKLSDFNTGRFLWIVPVVYGIVAGVEAVLAGSVVGLV